MRLKEQFVKRHVHSWKESSCEPRMQLDQKSTDQQLSFGSLGDFFNWSAPQGTIIAYDITRKCAECDEEQSAKLSLEEGADLPRSLWHLADIEWRRGD